MLPLPQMVGYTHMLYSLVLNNTLITPEFYESALRHGCCSTKFNLPEWLQVSAHDHHHHLFSGGLFIHSVFLCTEEREFNSTS
jgi:hypothetical protein